MGYPQCILHVSLACQKATREFKKAEVGLVSIQPQGSPRKWSLYLQCNFSCRLHTDHFFNEAVCSSPNTKRSLYGTLRTLPTVPVIPSGFPETSMQHHCHSDITLRCWDFNRDHSLIGMNDWLSLLLTGLPAYPAGISQPVKHAVDHWNTVVSPVKQCWHHK